MEMKKQLLEDLTQEVYEALDELRAIMKTVDQLQSRISLVEVHLRNSLEVLEGSGNEDEGREE